MVTDLKIWRAAKLLICQHRANAVFEETRFAGWMLDRGESEGQPVWARIRRAIEALQGLPAGGLHQGFDRGG
jgi:hypothetical protein